MTITDPAVYQATITLAESDISTVKVGQKAVLTFDALPDLTLDRQGDPRRHHREPTTQEWSPTAWSSRPTSWTRPSKAA